MEKAITSALAIVIFMSSAAAGPIKMNDKELDLIHGGNGLLQFSSITNSDGSAVFIYNGVEHKMTVGSSLSFPDGTKVELIQTSPAATPGCCGSGYKTLITKGDITGATWLFAPGGPSNSIANATLKLERVSVCSGSGCK
jgi:hypothetical protein